MEYFKQKIIPSTKSTMLNYKGPALRKAMFEAFKKISDSKKVVINKNLNIPVYLSNNTARKSCFGGSIYSTKCEAIKMIDKLIENAIYNNWGNPKPNENKNVIGYLNFKVNCLIDDLIYHLRISIQMRKDGKFYYNHEVNKW